MKLTWHEGTFARVRTDLLVLPVPAGEEPRVPAPYDRALAAARADLPGVFRRTLLLHPGRGAAAGRLLLVGAGPPAELTAERIRRLAALARNQAAALKARDLTLAWRLEEGAAAPGAAGAALAEGLLLAAYSCREFKGRPAGEEEEETDLPLQARLCVAGAAAARRQAEEGFRLGRAGAEGQNLARRWGDQPPNLLTPPAFAREAQALARRRGWRCQVLGERELHRLKAGAFLGVAQGSAQPPRLVVLETRPGARRSLALVGKGLTFDSGGISLKPGNGMWEMRHDMCGAAAVLGAMAALDNPRRLPWNLVGILGLAENMPDGRAQRPGDVVTALDGTTIEVLNTDAEGRLVLADCVAYARRRFKPEAIVTVATLTGAVVVALGHEATGLMATNDALAGAILAAGEASGERCWRLPLWPEYGELIKGQYADLRNIGKDQRGAGAILGGLFLARFAGDTPFAHLDIAGTAYGGRSRDYYREGAEGVGVRLLQHLLREGEAPWRE